MSEGNKWQIVKKTTKKPPHRLDLKGKNEYNNKQLEN